jgi:hypothetical protein
MANLCVSISSLPVASGVNPPDSLRGIPRFRECYISRHYGPRTGVPVKRSQHATRERTSAKWQPNSEGTRVLGNLVVYRICSPPTAYRRGIYRYMTKVLVHVQTALNPDATSNRSCTAGPVPVGSIHDDPYI